MISALIIGFIYIAARWMLYKKMGREGWESAIPLYNDFVLFEVLYGNGWKLLLFLIPLYNIYLYFKLIIDICHSFNKGGWWIFVMIFLPPVIEILLGLDKKITYKDGSYYNNEDGLFDHFLTFKLNKQSNVEEIKESEQA